MSKCELCGEHMPRGEEMFRYHGYSGPCPASARKKVVHYLDHDTKDNISPCGESSPISPAAFSWDVVTCEKCLEHMPNE